MTRPNEKVTLAEQLADLGSVQDRINRYSFHIDLCSDCRDELDCDEGERLKREMSE